MMMAAPTIGNDEYQGDGTLAAMWHAAAQDHLHPPVHTHSAQTHGVASSTLVGVPPPIDSAYRVGISWGGGSHSVADPTQPPSTKEYGAGGEDEDAPLYADSTLDSVTPLTGYAPHDHLSGTFPGHMQYHNHNPNPTNAVGMSNPSPDSSLTVRLLPSEQSIATTTTDHMSGNGSGSADMADINTLLMIKNIWKDDECSVQHPQPPAHNRLAAALAGRELSFGPGLGVGQSPFLSPLEALGFQEEPASEP